ncbi:MAG: heme-copper oxidase subunit III [Actinobacteria bacterium]|nr:heme-copper oxidase subunit III [Actinomycetota bacterium]
MSVAGVRVAERSDATDERSLPVHMNGPTAPAWWGMIMLIATEAMLFATLIASYFFLRFQAGPVWPPDDIAKPALELPLIMSVLLWSSSIPVHLGERAIKRGKVGMLKLWLALGFVIGAVFLGMQMGIEYPEKLAEFTPTTNSYGSLFFTITGFHGIHVLGGLIFNLWTQMRAWQGAFDDDRHVTVQNFTLYWHFVDIVWVFVLATIYLSPNL